jgi:hypothetical protein
MSQLPFTGGCQCGAVRYALGSLPTHAHICHCRMCQKAFGSYFAPLAHVPREDFAVTRGAIGWFQSSPAVRRGFCAACGTPLIYDASGEDYLNIALGSLDDPAAVRPQNQFGLEGRMPWFAELPGLPGDKTTEEDLGAEQMAHLASRQHPDHDTDHWPPDRLP